MKPDFKGSPVIFLKEVKSELLKVNWPSREEVIKLTVIVVVISTVIGLYIGGMDILLTKLTSIIFKR
ncbi:preprotein translocase subunit SecE [Candidatus Gottesmanbacteria bacterium RIFCSPHIGHO2_02_FULL_40_13]|uniref:Protein translocase subunit SecE n=1 Tax=Candidatus Gottesmanbacteria bacterium RIFCSPHIGHO2_02_FULL_40_13 TaxID=1798384 RepID=A0A1F6A7F5_9BACT|nr:MAG: preprotein translocase subunit SecE [Candidatus Gottesmanbacteria bacterium RIFCSPHIGHO2_02_FULL_40_13]